MQTILDKPNILINHVCSLGPLCHSSSIIQRNHLKRESYPFDWVFSDHTIIINCIKNKFKLFLDKTKYIYISNNKCGHLVYNNKMFWHHNPLNNIEHYNYYNRCIYRFNNLLCNTNNKLFILFFVNLYSLEGIISKIQNLILFNMLLKKYTNSNNYKLLIIFNVIKEKQYYNICYIENIDILELHTLSVSNGTKFINETDNIFLDDIINDIYKFNIISL